MHDPEKPMPPCPKDKLRVKAVQKGYFGDTDLEVNDVFDIPIEPVNPKTGLPYAFADSRVKVAPGRNGWMEPFDAEAHKKIAAMEAAFGKKPELATVPDMPKKDKK